MTKYSRQNIGMVMGAIYGCELRQFMPPLWDRTDSLPDAKYDVLQQKLFTESGKGTREDNIDDIITRFRVSSR